MAYVYDYIGTMIGPKAPHPLVDIYGERTQYDVAVDVRLVDAFFEYGAPHLGSGYTESEPGGPNRQYLRSHTPSGVVARGGGLGVLLYSGLALAAEHFHARTDIEGIYSIPGGRSGSAESWWHRAVKRDFAVRDAFEEEHERDVCAYVRGDEVVINERSARITTDEICDSVMITCSREFDILPAENVRKTGLVVRLAAKRDFTPPPTDLLIRASVNEPIEIEADFWRYVDLLQDRSDDAVQTFLLRRDILPIWANDAKRRDRALRRYFPSATRETFLGAAHRTLPPLSASTKKLLARWKDL